MKKEARSFFPHYERFLDCVHCGLCLPYCPTYRELGTEMDSPRGRIYLMRSVADGRLSLTEDVVEHLDLCLVCRACETACPSGVHFGELMEHARDMVEEEYKRPFIYRFLKNIFLRKVIPSPRLLSAAFGLFYLYQRLGLRGLVRRARLLKILPGRLDKLEEFMPTLPSPSMKRSLSEATPAVGERKYRVGFLSGCIMNQVFTQVNLATVRVLSRNGCEVVTPKAQRCCGALHAHSGMRSVAASLARGLIDAFEEAGVETIVVNSAGCGSAMKEYALLLEGDPRYGEAARRFSAKVKDVSEFLAEISLKSPEGRIESKVAYHDACHLAHAQGVRKPPRDILSSIPGIKLVPLKDSDRCCGSAGIYNLAQPEMAGRLLEDKVSNISSSGAEVVATGNPGCILQIASGVKRRGLNIEVVHPIELLDRAYQSSIQLSAVSRQQKP
jgi:glycolate oxidase iron-sulfur subunit